MNTPYRGRFAPSPTGELHLGSLAAALASYLQAKHHNGQWLIRIDDIDTPRSVAGSAESIIQSLSDYGLESDHPIDYQSQHLQQYAQAIEYLLQQQRAFHCACSRADMAADGSYPGTCRNGLPAGKKPRSIRLLAPKQPQTFNDLITGPQTDDIQANTGDVVIRRADGLFAYQLCTAIDDAQPNFTEVVRGADLLPSTAIQRYIQRQLGLESPRYAHIPVVLGNDGKKLSKRQNDTPLKQQHPATVMRHTLEHLKHQPPIHIATVEGLLTWAIEHWDIQRLTHLLVPTMSNND